MPFAPTICPSDACMTSASTRMTPFARLAKAASATRPVTTHSHDDHSDTSMALKKARERPEKSRSAPEKHCNPRPASPLLLGASAGPTHVPQTTGMLVTLKTEGI